MPARPLARLRLFVALVKFRYHITFISVITGALLFAPRVEARLFGELALLYVTFNVLLYGGIYTMNDIADRASDVRHPRKRCRPIAAGAVGVPAATCFAITLICAGVACGASVFETGVVACFVLALAFNLAYSLFGRNRRYLDLLLNSVTHPTRFLMGTLLVGRVPPATHLLVLMLLAIALSCLRRQVEKDSPGWRSRQTIAAYAPSELPRFAFACLMTLLGLIAMLAGEAPGFYAIVGMAVVVAVAGWFESPVRKGLREVWTR